MEWIYRKLVPAGVQLGVSKLSYAKNSVSEAAMEPARAARNMLGQTAIVKYHKSEDSWPTGSMVFWISITLVAYLLLDILVYV